MMLYVIGGKVGQNASKGHSIDGGKAKFAPDLVGKTGKKYQNV